MSTQGVHMLVPGESDLVLILLLKLEYGTFGLHDFYCDVVLSG